MFYKGFTWLPMAIFGSWAILSEIWCLFLPETAGLPIMLNIYEAEDFYNDRQRHHTTEKDILLKE